MSRIDARLEQLGIVLPEPFSPPPGVAFGFELLTVSGGLGWVSGHGPVSGSEVLIAGKVGVEVGPEEANRAARLTGLSIISSLRAKLGDLDRVTGWVKALGLVNCAPGFNATPG